MALKGEGPLERGVLENLDKSPAAPLDTLVFIYVREIDG